MIVVLTSNYNAGILQLALQMKNELKKIFGDSILFVPIQSNLSGEDIELYDRKSSLIPFAPCYKRIARRIESYSPQLVFICDTNLITARIALSLKTNIPIYSIVHDITSHPTYRSAASHFIGYFKKIFSSRLLKKATKIVLLSKHSYNQFPLQHPNLAEKRVLLPLGAHVPNTESHRPPELMIEPGFILFFGRIDKYKGLLNLLRTFEKSKDIIRNQLLIAGDGCLTSEEEAIIKRNSKSIVLLKRYISDGEMIWLYKNSSCVVLPYIESSQSGVLSIAYYFRKPVIVSDLEGLTEFLDEGKTGVVFHNADELVNYLIEIPLKSTQMSEYIANYYSHNLEWANNLKKIFMCSQEIFCDK